MFYGFSTKILTLKRSWGGGEGGDEDLPIFRLSKQPSSSLSLSLLYYSLDIESSVFIIALIVFPRVEVYLAKETTNKKKLMMKCIIMIIASLVLVLLATVGANALTQDEADTIVEGLDALWEDAYGRKDWDFMLSDLYCPGFVSVPSVGSELFVTRENFIPAFNASWTAPGTFKDTVLGVQIIPNGSGDPFLLEIGESTVPGNDDFIDVSNYSMLYAKCDDSGVYKIITDTWLVGIALVRTATVIRGKI